MTHPLRIALVLHRLARRSTGRYHAAHLSGELLGRGHVVQAFGVPRDAVPHAADEREEGVLEPLRLAEFDADVLVAYDARTPAAFFAARQARRSGSSLVIVEGGHGLRGGFVERRLRALGRVLWGGWVRRKVAAVVALDPAAKAELLGDGYLEQQIRMLAPGVDLTQYRPGLSSHLVTQHGLRGRLLSYIGPLTAGRGLETLLRAFANTVGQREDWSLVLAGEGPAAADLRATASRRGVGGRVRLIPAPRAEELPGLLGASTLVAAPVDDDIRVTRRAMACGVPVLAADLPRLRHLVEENGTGLFAPADDLEGWTRMLREAAQAPERRKRWGQRAREIAEQRFSWSVLAAEFEGIFEAARRVPQESSEVARLPSSGEA